LVLGTPGGGLRYLRPRELVTGLPTEIPLSPQALQLLPNPARAQVEVRTPAPGWLQVTDLLGRPRWQGPTPGQLVLPLAQWPAGVYLLTWQAANGQRLTAKLVVEGR
jgi:hypothetical protein